MNASDAGAFRSVPELGRELDREGWRCFGRSPVDYFRAPADPEAAAMRPFDGDAALRIMQSWPGYRPTPLESLDQLAAKLAVGKIYYKDESRRFGLNSFKPMGAAHALTLAVARHFKLGDAVVFGGVRDAIGRNGAPFAVTCASAGNHGCAVAWAARELGLRSVVFLHRDVGAAREAAVAAFGADIRRVAGTYDEAVRVAAQEAAANGWQIISDTAYAGYEQIPDDVTAGYAGLAAETCKQLPAGQRPTHVFAQAGVGGFAAGLFSHLAAPQLVVVEPRAAACLLASARAKCARSVDGAIETIMTGLACGTPSTTAWQRLSATNCHFLAIADIHAAAAMRLLADAQLIAGESGAAGLAGLVCACERPELRAALRLDQNAVVVLVGTEGATDPQAYATLAGGGMCA